jgi:putative SOS response-associated peptidase YedK
LLCEYRDLFIAASNGHVLAFDSGLWENWKDPASGEWMRTFAIITAGRRDSRSHAAHPRIW